MSDRHFGKLFGIFWGVLITFSVIALIFAGFYYSFGFFKKSINANVVHTDISNLVGPSEWLIITLLTSGILILILWFLQKKEIFVFDF